MDNEDIEYAKAYDQAIIDWENSLKLEMDNEDIEYAKAYDQAIIDWENSLNEFDLIKYKAGILYPEPIEVTTIGDDSPKFIIKILENPRSRLLAVLNSIKY